MKKLVTIAIAVLLVGAVVTATGFGWRAQSNRVPGQNCSAEAFVDEDSDGVCDNYALREQPRDGTGNLYGRIDRSGKGFRNGSTERNMGRGLRDRASFVDEDGDGICDNFATRPGAGAGNAYGRK